MTAVFGGWKPGYGPVLKIMKNDADDPLTTPNNHHGKFQFNSETTEVGYVDEIFNRDYNSSYAGATTYFPSGSNMDTCHSYVSTSNGYQRWSYALPYFGQSYWPLVECREARGSGKNVFTGPGTYIGDTGGGWFPSTARTFTNTGGRVANTQAIPVASHFRAFMRADVKTDPTRSVISVFDLPADETALPDVGTPEEGQEFFRFSPSVARIAKPGFAYNSLNPKNFILHENRIPAKIIKAGEISVPAAPGTATINTPVAFPLTASTYMDYHVRRNTADAYNQFFFNPPLIYNANPPDGIGFRYQVNQNSVVITNLCRFPIVVRYLILADSDQAPTTGGSKAVYVSDDGTYWQVKRPGSSDTSPNLNDIMLDTRLKYLPLLKTDWLRWPTDFPGVYSGGDRMYGERYVDVAIDNPTGVKLFTKHRLVFPATSDTTGTPTYWDKEIFEPLVDIFTSSGSNWNGRMSQASSYARIATDEKSVRLSMAGDNQFYASGGGWRNGPSGIRYYIFGLVE